nr:hypothetical protein [Tanacetum cinerariifolium]
MLMTMESEIQRNLEPLHAHEMLKELKTLFAQQAEHELLQNTRDFHSYRQEEGYMGKTVNELHAMLKLHEQTLPKSNAPALNVIRTSKVQKDKTLEEELSLVFSRVNEEEKEHDFWSWWFSNKRAKLDLDSALLWHCRLGHISKKRIEKLQHDGLLDSSDLTAFEKCVFCMSGKMARKPYTHQVERAKDLLGLIHTYVCDPFKIIVFQKEVENQLGKTIKSLRSDRGGEYMSQEFLDHLNDHGIIAHRTPPYTPQHNEEDTHPSLDTSLNHEEDDLEIDEPQSDIVPIRRSTRIRHALDRMCLYIDAEEHELEDLREPANYKAALLDPESEKWLNAMNVEMKSMKDNEVWVLVELPPNGKTVGSKWLFKKKTDMDRNVHIYKARLVAKGYTQTLGIAYEETFSPVADIRAIRILIAIAAYYDYEICLCQSAYIEKILKRFCMENSKCGSIPMQEKLKLSKSQGASTPAEMKRMQNVPYASAVGSIMYVVRCTRPDVANTKDTFLVYEGDLKREPRIAKQSIFATSYAEAEYIAAFDASKEVVWVRKFISGLGVVPTIKEPISMYCDNTGAIDIANESGITKGARHFRAKVHYLREVIEFGDIKLKKFHTDDNLADPFTKALAFFKHSEHTRNIGMLPASSLM